MFLHIFTAAVRIGRGSEAAEERPVGGGVWTRRAPGDTLQSCASYQPSHLSMRE